MRYGLDRDDPAEVAKALQERALHTMPRVALPLGGVPTGKNRRGGLRAPKDGPKPTSLVDPTLYPGLNWGQDTFARTYAQTADQFVALQAGGYSTGNLTTTACRARARGMLNHPRVKAAMVLYSSLAAKVYNASRESVLAQLVRFAWVDPAEYVDADGRPVPLHKLPREVRMAIQDFDIVFTDNGPVHRYRFVPKLKALELLAKITTLLDPAARDVRRQSRTRVRLRFEKGGEATVETIE